MYESTPSLGFVVILVLIAVALLIASIWLLCLFIEAIKEIRRDIRLFRLNSEEMLRIMKKANQNTSTQPTEPTPKDSYDFIIDGNGDR